MPIKVAIHVAKSAASQVGLTPEQIAWMAEHKSAEIIAFLANEEHRQNSILHLYGWDRTLVSILYTLVGIVLLVLLIKLLHSALSRVRVVVKN